MKINLKATGYEQSIKVERCGSANIELWTRVGEHGVAVDLTPPQARQLARELVRLADEIEEIR